MELNKPTIPSKEPQGIARMKGRKVLIMDTNGEYTVDQFEQNGHPNFPVKTIGVKDVHAWSRSSLVECRRIDMKSLHIDDKLKILSYIMQVIRNCTIVLEDINTITTDVNHMKNIVSAVVNLRHKGVDVIISYQSLRAVEPRILSNSKWIRLHHSLGDIMDIKGKLDAPDVAKIAQLIINTRYRSGDTRFFLYIYNANQKARGDFSEDEFKKATKQFLSLKPKKVRDFMNMMGVSKEAAYNGMVDELFDLYYGNDMPPPKDNQREAGMLVTAAAQGTGKTYQNMNIIAKSINFDPNNLDPKNKQLTIPSPEKR
jgi:hypothetical protein